VISPLVDFDPVRRGDEEEQKQQTAIGEVVLPPAARKSLLSTMNSQTRTCTESCDVPESKRLLLEELAAPTWALAAAR
jgi:hypothetical protein